MRISDWSSDVCSSDLIALPRQQQGTLEYDADAAVRLGDRLAVDADFTIGRRQQAGNHLQQGRLAATRRTNDDEKLAVVDLEVERLQRGDLTVPGSSEERRVGTGGVGTLRFRREPYH